MQPHPFQPHLAAPQFCAYVEDGVGCHNGPGHGWHEEKPDMGHYLPNYLWCERCKAWIETQHACGAQYVERDGRFELIREAVELETPSPATHFTVPQIAMIRRLILTLLDDGDPKLYSETDPKRQWHFYGPAIGATEERIRFVDELQRRITEEA